MNKTIATTFFFVFSISILIGQSKYAGVYSGTVSDGQRFLGAATGGGRGVGLADISQGINQSLDPSKSWVSASGKVSGLAPYGASVSATIDSRFNITGTLKVNGMTFRLNGKRIYK